MTNLTVIGIAFLRAESISCCLAPLLINTYWFFNLSAAASDKRGPQRLQCVYEHVIRS